MKKLVLMVAVLFSMVVMAEEGKKCDGDCQGKGQPSIEQRVDKVMTTFDKDKDGKLDKTELTEMVKARGQMGQKCEKDGKCEMKGAEGKCEKDGKCDMKGAEGKGMGMGKGMRMGERGMGKGRGMEMSRGMHQRGGMPPPPPQE